MMSILTIALKDFRLLLRDKGGFFAVFVFPILFAIFFGLIYSGSGGGSGGMRVAIVNEDGGPVSRAFVNDLRGDTVLRVLPAVKDDDGKVLSPEPMLTRDAAEKLLRTGDASAVIVVPKGFEEAAGSFLSGGALELETIVDPSRKAEAGMLEGKLNQYGFRVLGTALTDTTRTKKLVGDARTQVAQAKDLNPVQKLAISTLLSSVESLTESGVNIAGNAQAGDGESASP
ncbi:MAG TPA: ABC transporter permease, partial [Phycisphaerales bacterium]|nr:ABC transporter permease [Phycisphaerales bacterium]